MARSGVEAAFIRHRSPISIQRLLRGFSSSGAKNIPDYYQILGLPRKYILLSEEVDQAYRGQQKLFHPDKVAHLPEAERREMEFKSQQCNEAVTVLRSPLGRAKYWLSLHGIAEQEGQRIADSALLMEMMELYEKLDESPDSASEMEQQTAERIEEAETQIDELISDQKYQEVQVWMEKLALHLRLSEKIRNVLENGQVEG